MEPKLNNKTENKTGTAETKRTLIKSAAAVACVLSICLSANSALGKYSDSIAKMAETQNGNHVSDSESSTPSNDTYYTDTSTDISYNDFSDSTVDESSDGTADSTGNTDASVSASSDGNTESSTSSDNTASAPITNDPTKYNIAQVVNYYNTSLKNTYNLPKLTIDKVENIEIVIDNVTPGGNLVTKVGNKIVESYAGETPSSASFANGKNTSGGDDAQEFSMHASLAPAGVKTATVKKVGSGYEINIALKPEKATLQNRPTYNSQCVNPLDLGSVDLFGVTITQADFNYPATTLKATVDANGRVINAVSYMPMNGTGAGKFVGVGGSATVHGSMSKSATFKF